jgi:hypothetical protein
MLSGGGVGTGVKGSDKREASKGVCNGGNKGEATINVYVLGGGLGE